MWKQRLYFLPGILSLLAGLGLLVWVGYNVLVEELPGFELRSQGQLMLPFLLIGFGVFWLLNPRPRKPDPEE